MLPLKNRLKDRKDFNEVFKRGKAIFQGGLGLKFKENGLNQTRIGFSVGVAFSSKAVERNRIRRKMREFFRDWAKKMKKGYDVAVFLKATSREKKDFLGKNQVLSRILREILEKGRLIN